MLTYFDLKVDPFQLGNLLYTLTSKSIYFWIKNNCLLLHAQTSDTAEELLGEEEVPGEEIKEAEVAEEQAKASQDEKAEEVDQEYKMNTWFSFCEQILVMTICNNLNLSYYDMQPLSFIVCMICNFS